MCGFFGLFLLKYVGLPHSKVSVMEFLLYEQAFLFDYDWAGMVHTLVIRKYLN